MARPRKPPPPQDDEDSLFNYRPRYTSYLRPTGAERRRCWVFEKNPDWNGILQSREAARRGNPATSHRAAAMGQKHRDLLAAREYVDEIMAANGGTVIMTELREYVLRGIANGTIDSRGLAANVRAESFRRRFSDLCPV